MKCSELKPNDNVVFKVRVYGGDRKRSIFDGHVISVNPEKQTVSVCYLEGYKSRNDVIPFEHMIAKADADGKEMLFGKWIRGNSVLLTAE